jgi:hypothetical protein
VIPDPYTFAGSKVALVNVGGMPRTHQKTAAGVRWLAGTPEPRQAGVPDFKYTSVLYFKKTFFTRFLR